MAKALRNFRALKRTGTITIHDGPSEGPDAAPAIVLEFRKRGVIRIVDDVAKIPLLGEAIEKMVDGGLKGAGKGDVQAAAAAIKASITAAADDAGTAHGKAVREVIVGLPDLIVRIVIEDTILEEGEDPEDLRDLLRSLGPTALLNLATGWIELNLPEFRGPLLDLLVKFLSQGRKLARENGLVGTTAAVPVPPAVEAEETEASEQPLPAAA